MPTTATLTIDAFRTTLTITDPTTASDRTRFDIFGENSDGDWDRDPTGFFRTAADRRLDAAGWTRAGAWAYDTARDVHTAPLTPAQLT